MKVLTLLLLLATQVSPAATLPFGGNSGGGGNLARLEPINEETLASFIEYQVPKLARWHFNFVAQPYTIPADRPPRWLYFETSSQDGSQFPGELASIMTQENAESAYRKLFLQ